MKRILSAVLLSLTMLFSSVPNVYAENTEYTIRDEIHGVNDSVFYIARPDETSLTVINASQYTGNAECL